LGMAALVLAGLGGGGWWLAAGRYKTVPAVGQLTASAATQTLRAAGFQVRTGPSVIDGSVPKGEVISASPSGRALPGATITLTLSQGPPTVTVPQIPAGDTVDQATALLRAHGLAIQVSGQVDSDQPQGTVVSQSPAPGASVPAGQTVTVTVSSGMVVIPDLTGQDCQQAAQTLQNLGFNPQVQHGAFGTVFGDGTVQSMSPTGQAARGATVTLQCRRFHGGF
ncbi:MAG TPA: PASTA domain-containing protein, partial [Trebonia sp.]|nr:PASTA domain-containing protein [Trebonia sp.]